MEPFTVPPSEWALRGGDAAVGRHGDTVRPRVVMHTDGSCDVNGRVGADDVEGLRASLEAHGIVIGELRVVDAVFDSAATLRRLVEYVRSAVTAINTRDVAGVDANGWTAFSSLQPSITSLRVVDCGLGDAAVDDLAQLIVRQRLPELRTLELTETDGGVGGDEATFTAEGFLAVVKSASHLAHLSVLHVSGPRVSHDVYSDLAVTEFMETASALALDVRFGDAGAIRHPRRRAAMLHMRERARLGHEARSRLFALTSLVSMGSPAVRFMARLSGDGSHAVAARVVRWLIDMMAVGEEVAVAAGAPAPLATLALVDYPSAWTLPSSMEALPLGSFSLEYGEAPAAAVVESPASVEERTATVAAAQARAEVSKAEVRANSEMVAEGLATISELAKIERKLKERERRTARKATPEGQASAEAAKLKRKEREAERKAKAAAPAAAAGGGTGSSSSSGPEPVVVAAAKPKAARKPRARANAEVEEAAAAAAPAETEEAESEGEDSKTLRDNDLVDNDVCFNCGDGGDLICCDTCDFWFDLKCAGLAEVPGENEPWECPDCADGVDDLFDDTEETAETRAKAASLLKPLSEAKKELKSASKAGGAKMEAAMHKLFAHDAEFETTDKEIVREGKHVTAPTALVRGEIEQRNYYAARQDEEEKARLAPSAAAAPSESSSSSSSSVSPTRRAVLTTGPLPPASAAAAAPAAPMRRAVLVSVPPTQAAPTPGFGGDGA